MSGIIQWEVGRQLTALSRNSRCAGVNGLESGAGDAEAAGPERGTRDGSNEGAYEDEDFCSIGTVSKILCEDGAV